MPIKNKLYIRSIQRLDQSILFKWTNDRETRGSSLNPRLIKYWRHKLWFSGILNSRYKNPALICLKKGKVRIGIIRFTRLPKLKNKWEIHFTVAPRYRGMGLAKAMLEKALRWFRRDHHNQIVIARVKKDNLKSLNVLISLGFAQQKIGTCKSDLIHLRLSAR